MTTDRFLKVNYPELVTPKSEGTNQSEKKLINLGYKTFLRLWSFPNPFKEQDVSQELCDLLVVFEDDIIIFSDKEISYKNTEEPETAWRRWYKRAIKESCQQLLGAKHWIERFPNRVSLNADKKPLPIPIHISDRTRFHLIAVAHGAEDACKQYFHCGDGSLMIDSSIIGDEHIKEKCELFQIGLYSSNPDDFIHVFDDLSYSTILKELDTIRDFTYYLNVRKELFLKKKVIASSEVDLLALHLDGITRRNKAVLQEHLKSKVEALLVKEGIYRELVHKKDYSNWKDRIRLSYFWDNLLEETFLYIERGQSRYTDALTIEEQSNMFHWMAAEDRDFRIICSEAILGLKNKTKYGMRATRVFSSPSSQRLAYLILFLPIPEGVNIEDYRDVRRQALSDYCSITKYLYPQYEYVIGIAHETNDNVYSSADFAFLNAVDWTTDEQEKAEKTYMDFKIHGLIGEISATKKSFFAPGGMKGRDRNKLCPCGSGKKYKRCCGRY